MPLFWVLSAAGIGFTAGFFSQNKTTLLLIGAGAAYLYLRGRKDG